jgi:hypothetical protein
MVFDPDGVGTVPEGYPLLPDDERAHAMCAAVTAFYSFDTVDGPVTWGERVDAARPYTVGSLADAIAYADPTGQVTARSTAIWPDVAAHADAYCFPTSYPTRFTSYHEDGALVARMSLLVRVDVTGQLGEQWTEVYQVANMAAASLSVDGSVTQTGRWMVVNWTPWPIAAGFEWTVLEGERYPFHP